jgi:hypothetical protein
MRACPRVVTGESGRRAVTRGGDGRPTNPR